MNNKALVLKTRLQRLSAKTVKSIVCRHLPKKTWECFCDESYYGMWAVREVGERRWGYCFHLPSKDEAEGLTKLLNDRVNLGSGESPS